jgi:MoxR-like ATPase
VDLTARASEGRIDPVIGRRSEIERIVHLLRRRTENNPILLGESGVGKTALATGLAIMFFFFFSMFIVFFHVKLLIHDGKMDVFKYGSNRIL